MRHEWDWAGDEPAAEAARRRAADLAAALEGATPEYVLSVACANHGRRIALVSSFGAEAAALLHMCAQIDPALPVLLIDTQMLFPETLDYCSDLARHLGLTDVRAITSDPTVLRLADPGADLHRHAPDDCCHLRKTLPLDTALLGFEAWITGRKRHQTSARAAMPVVEADAAGRRKFNPLANWAPGAAQAYIARHDLPRHPLIERSMPSIGCMPCTVPVAAGEDPRAGRWRGTEKTECGIHIDPDGCLRPAHAKGADR